MIILFLFIITKQNLHPKETFEILYIDVKTFHYSDVNDVDVFVGGVTETPRDDALVGPLFECLLGRQFHDIKFGDRYWYERNGVEGFPRRKYKVMKIFLKEKK